MALLFLAFMMTAIPFVVGSRTGLLPMLSPLHVLSYLLFLGVAVKTIYTVLFDGVIFFQYFYVSDSAAFTGYIFILFFVISICVGYLISSLKAVTYPSRLDLALAFEKVNRPNIIAAFGIASALAILFFLITSRGLGGFYSLLDPQTLSTLNSDKIARIEGQQEFGASGSAVKIFIILQKFALIFFLARAILRKGSFVPFLLFLSIDAFMITVQGSRVALVNTFLIILMVPLLFSQRIKLKNLALGGAVAILILLLFVAMTNFRAARSGIDTEFSIEPAVEQIVSSTYFMDISAPTLVIALSDEDDRFWGASYLSWTWGWIPRAVWAEKPAIDTGLYLKREILNLRGTIGGINTTGPGEAFLNFGWFGLIVGLFYGVIFRMLEVATLSKRGVERFFGLWLYPLTIVPFIMGLLQSSFSGVLVASAVATIILMVFLKLISRMPTRKLSRRLYSGANARETRLRRDMKV